MAAASESRKAVKTFISDNAQKQAEASRQIADQEQQLIKAHKRRDSTTIRSPIKGVVQASTTTTVGQVVTGASRFQKITEVLKTPIKFFFEDLSRWMSLAIWSRHRHAMKSCAFFLQPEAWLSIKRF